MIYDCALLTAFVAWMVSMTERYDFAYLKYMAVVGETIGHRKVCQLVYDDTLHDPSIIAMNMVAPLTSNLNYGSAWMFLPFNVVRSEDDEFGYIMENPCNFVTEVLHKGWIRMN